jgi:hypothetical protein
MTSSLSRIATGMPRHLAPIPVIVPSLAIQFCLGEPLHGISSCLRNCVVRQGCGSHEISVLTSPLTDVPARALHHDSSGYSPPSGDYALAIALCTILIATCKK